MAKRPKRVRGCPACGMGADYHADKCPLKPPPVQAVQNAQPADSPWWRRTPILIGAILFVIQIAAIVFAAGSIKSDIDHLQQDVNEMKQWKSDLERYMRGGGVKP